MSPGERYLIGLERQGMVFGLRRIRRVVELLGEPQRRFASVHVVGSNGKSSTARMIAAALEAHGVRAGCFTSPHIHAMRDRIVIDGAAIDPADFEAAVRRVRAAAQLVDLGAAADDRVTQFEALTAVALHAFAAARVEVAVVEAGLGGRLDATNVLRSAVQVLTSVSLEHTDLLGDDLASIAGEKLDVVTPGGVLVLAEALPDAAVTVARQTAQDRQVRIVDVAAESRVTNPSAGAVTPGDPSAAEIPAYQRRNAAVALAATRAIVEQAGGVTFDGAAARSAIHAITLPGRIPGRFEIAGRCPTIIYDSAHNPEAMAALVASARPFLRDGPVIVVLGMLADKDIKASIAELAGFADAIVACSSTRGPRARDAVVVEEAARSVFAGAGSQARPDRPSDLRIGSPAIHRHDRVTDALAFARSLAGKDGTVIVTGSNYLIAELVAEPAALVSSL